MIDLSMQLEVANIIYKKKDHPKIWLLSLQFLQYKDSK
jgi:hypothetical protein